MFLRVHAAHGSLAELFDLWRIRGRKHLTLASDQVVIEALQGEHHMRARLDSAVRDGVAFEASVPLDARLRQNLPNYQTQLAMLRGESPPVHAREITRAGLLHLRALQALDARRQGASHREIAEVLFGAEAVLTRWSADGELRAQVRHVLFRAQGFLRGGYLALAGVSRKAGSTETDKAAESLPPGCAALS